MTGTGLGLFGVRTRAEGLQGTCGARHNTESSTGTGTVLWFSLPYVPIYNSNNSIGSSAKSAKSNRLAADAFYSLQAAFVPPTPVNPPLSVSANFERSEKTGRVMYESSLSRRRHNSAELREDVTPSELRCTLVKMETQANLFGASATSAIGANQTATELLIRALKLTAMVVEDTPTVRKLMQKLLLSMGFESVVCYENGSKGLEAMMAGPVDIVFSDVQMPIMTGPEVGDTFWFLRLLVRCLHV